MSVTVNCDYCESRVKNWNGDDPECGFDILGNFKVDNWKCDTLSRFRKIAYDKDYDVYGGSDQNGCMIPDGNGNFIVMTWYKSRGKTDTLHIINNNITIKDVIESGVYSGLVLTDESICKYFINLLEVKEVQKYNDLNAKVIIGGLKRVLMNSGYGILFEAIPESSGKEYKGLKLCVSGGIPIKAIDIETDINSTYPEIITIGMISSWSNRKFKRYVNSGLPIMEFIKCEKVLPKLREAIDDSKYNGDHN